MTSPATSVEAFENLESRVSLGVDNVTLLTDGAETYPAMLEAIASARSTICLETYIFADDFVGRRFAEALAERARAGVEVNLLIDAWGSPASPELFSRLQEAGVRFVIFHPLRLDGLLGKALARLRMRNHRKVLVVDGRVGFLGGLNVSAHYAPLEEGGDGWRDTHVRIEGPSARKLEQLFLRTWKRADGERVTARRYDPAPVSADSKLEFVANGFFAQGRWIRAYYVKAIRAAERRVWITNAYFLPPRKLLKALAQAARRGADVRLITAGTSDVPLVTIAARGLYGSLLRAGVRIFEWNGRVLHAKTATFDGETASVGSTNLDTLSLQVNLELNVTISSPRFASLMEAQFERDLARCQEVRLETYVRRTWGERLFSRIALLFRGWL